MLSTAQEDTLRQIPGEVFDEVPSDLGEVGDEVHVSHVANALSWCRIDGEALELETDLADQWTFRNRERRVLLTTRESTRIGEDTFVSVAVYTERHDEGDSAMDQLTLHPVVDEPGQFFAVSPDGVPLPPIRIGWHRVQRDTRLRDGTT